MTLPDRVYMNVPADENECKAIALKAVEYARRYAPKVSGASARRFEPIHGEGWFGIMWVDSHVWYQEKGIRPFTMRRLAGKTIPMWLNDPTGELERKERANRKQVEVRTTEDGRKQVRVFRKAAKQGQRKQAWRRRGGSLQRVDVPASYPGAPGRIAQREAPQRLVPGASGGRIARGNVGVRWRHPGMAPKGFLYDGMVMAAWEAGFEIEDVIATNPQWEG